MNCITTNQLFVGRGQRKVSLGQALGLESALESLWQREGRLHCAEHGIELRHNVFEDRLSAQTVADNQLLVVAQSISEVGAFEGTIAELCGIYECNFLLFENHVQRTSSAELQECIVSEVLCRDPGVALVLGMGSSSQVLQQLHSRSLWQRGVQRALLAVVDKVTRQIVRVEECYPELWCDQCGGVAAQTTLVLANQRLDQVKQGAVADFSPAIDSDGRIAAIKKVVTELGLEALPLTVTMAELSAAGLLRLRLGQHLLMSSWLPVPCSWPGRLITDGQDKAIRLSLGLSVEKGEGASEDLSADLPSKCTRFPAEPGYYVYCHEGSLLSSSGDLKEKIGAPSFSVLKRRDKGVVGEYAELFRTISAVFSQTVEGRKLRIAEKGLFDINLRTAKRKVVAAGWARCAECQGRGVEQGCLACDSTGFAPHVLALEYLGVTFHQVLTSPLTDRVFAPWGEPALETLFEVLKKGNATCGSTLLSPVRSVGNSLAAYLAAATHLKTSGPLPTIVADELYVSGLSASDLEGVCELLTTRVKEGCRVVFQVPEISVDNGWLAGIDAYCDTN